MAHAQAFGPSGARLETTAGRSPDVGVPLLRGGVIDDVREAGHGSAPNQELLARPDQVGILQHRSIVLTDIPAGSENAGVLCMVAVEALGDQGQGVAAAGRADCRRR